MLHFHTTSNSTNPLIVSFMSDDKTLTYSMFQDGVGLLVNVIEKKVWFMSETQVIFTDTITYVEFHQCTGDCLTSKALSH